MFSESQVCVVSSHHTQVLNGLQGSSFQKTFSSLPALSTDPEKRAGLCAGHLSGVGRVSQSSLSWSGQLLEGVCLAWHPVCLDCTEKKCLFLPLSISAASSPLTMTSAWPWPAVPDVTLCF